MRGLRPFLLGLAALVAAGASAIAFAATLPTASRKVTTASIAATIPPTICTLAAIADAYVDQSVANSGTNYGSASTLDVRSFQTAAPLPDNRRVFVKFNIAGCGIPPTAAVATASLQLYLGTAPSGSRTYDVHRVTATWSEMAVKWSNQPAWSATAAASLDSTAAGARSASVLAEVMAFIGGGTVNNGWVIKDRTENSSTSYQGSFNSDEASSQRPALVVGYYP